MRLKASSKQLNISGSGEHDNILGSRKSNVLNGGKGDDILDGRGGKDILTGGPGADFFVISSGQDQITDFNPSEGDQKLYAATLAEGRQLQASLNQRDVRRVALASIDLFTAAGAPLSESEVKWVLGLAGLT